MITKAHIAAIAYSSEFCSASTHANQVSILIIRHPISYAFYVPSNTSVNVCVKDTSYPEERHGGSAFEGAVRYLVLLSQILYAFDGGDHPLDREECRQVGGVRRDHDECEEPPHGSDDPRAGGLRVQIAALVHQGNDGEPEGVGQRELVLHHPAVAHTRVRVLPLVGGEPGLRNNHSFLLKLA